MRKLLLIYLNNVLSSAGLATGYRQAKGNEERFVNIKYISGEKPIASSAVIAASLVCFLASSCSRRILLLDIEEKLSKR